MTDLPQKTRNRRRRHLAVALAVLLLGYGAWWYWTRVDQRFVGKWRVIVEEKGQQFETTEVLHFFDNGTCVQYLDGQRQEKNMWWYTPDNEFVLDWNPRDFMSMARQIANDTWTRPSGSKVSRTGMVRFTVVKVTPDEVTLNHSYEGDKTVRVIRNRRIIE